MSTRRTGFALYTEKDSLNGERIAITLAIKNINCELVVVDPADPPEDLLDVNSQLILPCLMTREVALYYSDIILEFIDERFPHPPLLPNDPISRGKSRLVLKKATTEWYPLIEKAIEKGKADRKTTKEIQDLLTAINPLFEGNDYFQSEDFSVIDATILPFLWWLDRLEIAYPKNSSAIRDYADRLLTLEPIEKLYAKKDRII